MNFDKIRKELRDHGYIDERNVVCHSMQIIRIP